MSYLNPITPSGQSRKSNKHQKKNDLIPWKEVKGKGGGADGAELTPSVQGTAQLTEWLEDLRPALTSTGNRVQGHPDRPATHACDCQRGR